MGTVRPTERRQHDHARSVSLRDHEDSAIAVSAAALGRAVDVAHRVERQPACQAAAVFPAENSQRGERAACVVGDLKDARQRGPVNVACRIERKASAWAFLPQ